MADPHEDDIPEGTTWGAHMRALRRQNALILELLNRSNERMDRLTKAVGELQIDVNRLENSEITRHGDILNILERLDAANVPTVNRFGSASGS